VIISSEHQAITSLVLVLHMIL